MKRSVIILAAMALLASCSFFEKPSMTQEEIDAMVTEKAALQEQIANLKQELDLALLQSEECRQLLEAQTQKAEASGNYVVVAGSFKEEKYAESYVAAVQQAGGTGEIVYGPSEFKLVVYSSHNSISAAAESMYQVRNGFSPDAWIYKQK